MRAWPWTPLLLFCAGCTLRSPPGPWPSDWTGWEDSKDVTTTSQVEPEAPPAFDEPWAEFPVGPAGPEFAAVAQTPPAEAPDAVADANTDAHAAPAEAPAEAPVAPAKAPETPAPEGSATADSAPPEAPAGTDPAGASGSEPAVTAEGEPAPAEPAPLDPGAVAEAKPPAPPLSESQVLGQQVFNPEDAPLGTLEDLIVDPSDGEVLGAILTPVEGKPRFLSTRDLAERTGGGALVAATSTDTALAMAELFAAEDIVPVKGTLISIEEEANGPEGSALLKVRDAENLLHRIRLSAPDLVLHQFPGLEPGKGVVAEAAATRDGEGKVWIAAALSFGEQNARIRDDSGTLLWEELSAKMLSGRSLLGRSVAHEGAAYTLTGWSLSPSEGRIASVTLRSEAGTVTVPWSAVSLTGEAR